MGENAHIEILQTKGVECKIENYTKWNCRRIDNPDKR